MLYNLYNLRQLTNDDVTSFQKLLMNGRYVATFCDDRTHVCARMDDLFAHVPRCILGAGGRIGGKASGEKRRPDRDGDFETRVMAFLVLSCIRTLTLLAYIRAWSWLPSTFLPSGNHISARLYMFAVLCTVIGWDGCVLDADLFTN